MKSWKVKYINELMFGKESDIQVEFGINKKGNLEEEIPSKMYTNTKYYIKQVLGKVIPSFQLISKIKLVEDEGKDVEISGKIESVLSLVDDFPTFEYKLVIKDVETTKRYFIKLVENFN